MLLRLSVLGLQKGQLRKPEGARKMGTIPVIWIEPAGGSVVEVGSKLRVRTRVKYHRLVGSEAAIALILQDQEHRAPLREPVGNWGADARRRGRAEG